jgi:hypothetical protein
MMKATIDRIEGQMAVLLAGDEPVGFNIPLSLLPEGCKEGDVLNLAIERDLEETQDAKERVSSLMERLKKKSQDQPGIVE